MKGSVGVEGEVKFFPVERFIGLFSTRRIMFLSSTAAAAATRTDARPLLVKYGQHCDIMGRDIQ